MCERNRGWVSASAGFARARGAWGPGVQGGRVAWTCVKTLRGKRLVRNLPGKCLMNAREKREEGE